MSSYEFMQSEIGQGTVEYGLVISLVVVVSIGALGMFGFSVGDLINMRIVPKLNEVFHTNKLG